MTLKEFIISGEWIRMLSEVLEIEDSKKLSDSQKLVKFFAYKWVHNRYYTNSLFYDSPLGSNRENDYNLQEIMSRIVEIPLLGGNVPCYTMFPHHLIMTNNYDPYHQKTIYEKIWEEMDAHRLSTVRNADKIVVVNYGEIVEIGTHDELLHKDNSVYGALYKTQIK